MRKKIDRRNNTICAKSALELMSFILHIIIADTSPDKKYCYVDKMCALSKASNVPTVTTYTSCCEEGGGSWGLHRGYNQSMCKACAEVPEPSDDDYVFRNPHGTLVSYDVMTSSASTNTRR